MLLQLNINNFALIENLTVSFGVGFNVLSGETGAGKSILIDAINYIIGNKFNRDLIRIGEKKTFVEAVFTIENPKTKEILISKEIEFEEDLLIISRETFQSGRSIAKVNGKSILLAELKDITCTILDIHGQHENQNLLLWENHINYVDDYGEDSIKALIENYSENYKKLYEIKNKINRLSGNNGDRKKISDFLKYQIDEINSANLKEEEENELNKKFKLLSSSEKINNTLNNCYTNLYSGFENKKSIQDELGNIIKDISSIKNIDNKIENIHKLLEDAYYNIEESVDEIRSIIANNSYDEKELEYINNRLYEISGYKKKYGNTIKDILEYRKKISNEYKEIIDSEDIINELKKSQYIVQEKLKIQARKIHVERCNVSKVLENKVKDELKFIGLEKSIFKIKIDLQDKFMENGMDIVQFYISTNPGQPLKPLEKIVSGGELSRIMLALKTVFVDKDKISSVIFDEIDTGISGRIAQRTAEKMYAISKKHQVLCVTHLPQIAAISDTHYLVLKDVHNNNTYTRIKKLNNEEKEHELAKMLGGSEVTEITLAHAKELIKMADAKKKLYS
ncbi:DNA repair protein RecN [Clostridium tyrobutyricum]|jgi:DNA repair protein RecN (Recombination protein N)|uniref:DNA repair protein RecN n=1 Tax=Clostridium tyrobutyricum TaxID=1519 RepID=UPI00057F3A30|nr:DNA repair protein RecN [Clostridium tyrobutyricum]MBV4415200.1 DNA repair protein RecN [Clostridium tyrobutyricum]MBV4420871.1 DNA repair protein RecN [Clostridium tyrobutyricum]MBV4423980.1 DNA repair protein RecN [Clostridium tyrobutyricum]MBV4426857.1 DNA repair protein RecN [Clostridium tyrobutyricum]MBV4429825.1 DNA repair protein RecN [Clostridium tyrobutyricum]